MEKAESLIDEILMTAEITCTYCRKTDCIQCYDDIDAAEYFYKEGWRKGKVNVYCPKCAKKKLKS